MDRDYCQQHDQPLKRRVGIEGDDVSYFCEACERSYKEQEKQTWACPHCGCNTNDKITNTACWHCGWERKEV